MAFKLSGDRVHLPDLEIANEPLNIKKLRFHTLALVAGYFNVNLRVRPLKFADKLVETSDLPRTTSISYRAVLLT